MIAAILLALAAAQASPPAPADSDDIVVLGERMKHLKIVMKKDRQTGRKRCLVKPSSGDAILDTGICDTYLACLPKVETGPAMEACMRPPLTTLVASWAERRKQRLGGSR